MKKGINNPGFKALPSSVQNNILSNMKYGGKKYAAGGAMPMEQLTEFNEGGRHEENSLGGIPQGMNPEGQMNLVEEGETKFDAENYIYSDSLKVDKELAEAFNLSPKMVGKTFADASKMAGRKKSKREGDAIEEAANNRDLENLMEAQEAFKQARIEEKLQEIAELDPNALPALMGQGQPQGGPQGDPTMGGQMQEAPMDEQAMMEQQMMAQQGGGGQPSPEEMAMMQQQQNTAMGQQEGMMRAGGPLNPPYGPITEKESELQDDYKRAKKYAYETDLTFNPEKLVRMQPLNWEDVSLEDYRKMVNTPKSEYYYFDRADNLKLAPEAEKLGGYLGDGKSSFSKRSYAPGGFMGMNMANAGMMTPEPCGGPNQPPCPGEKTGFSKIKIGRTEQKDDGFTALQNTLLELSPGMYRPTLSVEEKQAQKAQKAAEKLAMDAPSNEGLNYTYLTQGNVESLDNPAFEGVEVGIPAGSFVNRNKLARRVQKSPTEYFYKPGDINDQEAVERANLLNQARIDKYSIKNLGGSLDQDPPFNYTVGPIPNTTPTIEEAQYMTLRPGITGERSSSAGPKKYFDAAKKIMPPNEFRGYKQNLAIGNPNLANTTMRRGGKMCYGCGGAMHNYGGRMNRLQHKYGAGMKTAGTVLDTVADFAKFIPVVGQVVAPIAEAGANVLQGAGEAKATDTAYSWKDAAFDAGSGAAGTFVPGAEQAIQAAGDMATKKEKTAEMQKKQEILNDPSHPNHEQVKQAMEDRSTDKSLQNAETFSNVWNKTAGMASKFISPGENVDGIGEAMDTLPIEGIETIPLVDSIPDMNFARYGKKLYKGGGGLWANIHAKRARIAAGSGERMRKPGSKGAPTAEALKNSQNAMGGRMYYPGGYLFGPAGQVPEQTNTDNEFNNMYPDISEALEQTPLQQAALYAPIAKNIFDATLAKSKDYNPDFVPAEFVQLDSAQAIQQEKQRNAGLVAAARAKGFNNPSTMLALNQALQGTVANVQTQYDQVNARLKQAKLDKDNTQKIELSKLKKSLKMQLDEAKNAAANEALTQAKQIAENKTANKLAALYATMGAPDMSQNFMGNRKMTKAQIDRAIKKLEEERKNM